ncbi:MAG: urate oxidase [Pseudonocardiales bacterium]|nr:urate oxidase [Pseudonocardiales bacterium]
MAVTLGHNQYGKAEVRLVRITKHDATNHDIKDVNVTTQLYGDFADCHYTGDNANLIATDTQKNTVYALAKKHNVGSIEDFGQLLVNHFHEELEPVTGGHAIIEEYGWSRIEVDGSPHGHAFSRGGSETRRAVVTKDGDDLWITAGVSNLVVLKSTGSEFTGYPKTQYTTLQETTDRVLATAVTVHWRYNSTEVDWEATFTSIKAIILSTFARIHSLSLQQTQFGIAEAIIDAHPEVDEVRLSMPNKHHFVVDLSPFGMENDQEVFYAADRPYGLIESIVYREGAPEAPRAWDAQRGIC